MTVKANQKTLHRQIRNQFQGKRKILFVAMDQEISNGRNTTWIVAVTTTGTRDGRAFQETHLFLTSLRTTPEALVQLVRDRWSMHDITALLEMAMRRPGPKTC